MNVAIAGAHGQIALRLARLLAAEGDRVIGLIRNPDHAAEVSRAGAIPVRCDLKRASVEEIATATRAQTPWPSPRAPDPVAGPSQADDGSRRSDQAAARRGSYIRQLTDVFLCNLHETCPCKRHDLACDR